MIIKGEREEVSIKRRVGKFTISRLIIEDYENNKEVLSLLFSKVIITRAEFLYHCNSIEYVAISEEFDEISPELLPPSYRVVADRINKTITFINEDSKHSKIQERLENI